MAPANTFDYDKLLMDARDRANFRVIKEFPIRYPGTSRARKWGVNKRKRKEKKQFLITGCGRSGTTTIQRTLKAAGKIVEHEYCMGDGCVSWYFATDSDWHPYHPWDKKQLRIHVGQRRSDFEFKHVLHQVRHPLRAIASMRKAHLTSDYEFFEDAEFCPPISEISKLAACMHVWHKLNLQVEKEADLTYKLEDLKNWWPTISEYVETDEPFPNLTKRNRATGYNKPVILCWNDLKNVDKELYLTIRNQAERYGY